MREYTKQQAFDRAYKKVLEQGGPSVGKTSYTLASALYRGEDNKRCAVGWLIPNKDYVARWDINTYEYGLRFAARHITDVPDIDTAFHFLEDLQKVHDGLMTVKDKDEFEEGWKKGMLRFANRHGLEFPEKSFSFPD